MSRGVLGWVVFILFSLMLVMVVMQNLNKEQVFRYDEFLAHLDDGQIKRVVIREDAIVGELKGPAQSQGQNLNFKVELLPGSNFDRGVLANKLYEKGVEVRFDNSSNYLINILISFIPWLLVFAFIWFIVLRQLRGVGGGPGGMLGNFGRSRHRVTTKEHTNVTFADVAGIDEAKEECTEIIEFLKNPKRFQRLGGRIPRGVLLVGEPGCGKTLLAKAIAGEADVPFFSISGSDFVEMFVGVGASRVRDLFKQAKENAPCIIFLDEIDAVGRKRGSGWTSGGHDEREQTLNAILVEMDGFDTSDQVIVCAATNRADVLDPALVRPGRFDRQVYVPLPDVKGRLEILRVHARKIKLGPDVDLHRLARGTPMFSGADLSAIINEAALLATLANKDAVEMSDLEEARDKVRWGRAKKSRVIDEKEKIATAYHEAGHALVQCLLPDADPLHKVSIIPRGPYGGASFSLPEKDHNFYGRKWLAAKLRIACAGRIAEELTGYDINTGASSDIRQATDTARKMVTEWGMSDKVGFVYYGDDPARHTGFLDLPGGHEYSQTTAQAIDEEVRKLINEAYEDTRRLLEENRDKLEAVAQALVKYETLEAAEVHALIRGESLRRPTLADLLDADQLGTSASTAPAKPRTGPALPQPGLGSGPLPQPG
ncbi:MAG TPA: ATP-dependent zinc metalloprotease FtsH [Phycisphaerae bacterium]|jgi:cell division protease FtsH|nr:ATP-dependent zinc metalloprotease FtsH [Phycisphaerae bacterium]HOB76071.1 ATP-dependent zinc metalloprotease FtsH [Phycisphaerae bacterium]HOJ55467.1 ATP-dependent zinc metalloprotease FtsH [Phycisphaerae bacterium]HOL25696.1 ATP-dependent zinc metalloprotease FtsH [Phycisphaerae bacterium]HPP19611.1 ATP-dependent zinc metalloprotease FtsH [Phycisphaerae bacterium]